MVQVLDLLIIGVLLLTVTLGSGWIDRLPISYPMIYLIVGLVCGPYMLNIIQIKADSSFIEQATEIVVLISLFSCGLKMNRPLRLSLWEAPIRLIALLMPITIFAIAAVAHLAIGLSWGEGILLGAILAPTDPVLASEVQLEDPNDQDGLRFGLTSEGGINDAAAFPFVYFGLRWLENDDWQSWFPQWVGVDLLWATVAGFVMGILVPRAIVWIDKRVQKHQEVDEIMEEFVAFSIILTTYALTEIVNGYGFLAVFVAGMVTQRSYQDPEKRFAQLEFIERFEKLLEVGIILLVGSYLQTPLLRQYLFPGLLFGGLLLFVIRPIGVWISTIGARYHPARRLLFGWFGVRGVGSLYYLFYAANHGLEGATGEKFVWITIITLLLSVFIHGTTSTPIMHWYDRYTSDRNRKLQRAIESSPLELGD